MILLKRLDSCFYRNDDLPSFGRNSNVSHRHDTENRAVVLAREDDGREVT